ncbi:TPA: hypothetical protein N0F65_009454 [Lagenidium giganteum]|uniref:Guanylate cyclase domain-containing protein n=1 Tax=Lagenidium giganteum TaxID=4803 RepID=A0AAV2ZGI5_9STRA|nr:TPA: hypothetical protein N0F65_009454 [Lagenidium giganteum]
MAFSYELVGDANIQRSLKRQMEVLNSMWAIVYAVSLFLSCVMASLATFHMRRMGGDLFRSTVRFVITCFFVCTAVHSLAGGLFYSFLAASLTSAFERDDAIEVTDEEIQKAEATSGSDAMKTLLLPDNNNDGEEAALITKLTHGSDRLSNALSALLVAENIFFVLSAYWIFLITRELFKLAMTTLDRGEACERRVIKLYASGAMFIFAGFIISAAAIVIPEDGYNKTYKLLSILELLIIIASIFYSLVSLCVLRSKGRRNEHVHGMLMISPLYRRLKLMMIVCAVFTLPYCLLQFVLLVIREDQVDVIPDYIVGIFTTLYYLFGAAQAFVMAASQDCCLSIIWRCIPLHVRNSPEWQHLRHGRRSVAANPTVIKAPKSNPVFVNTDIESSSALWAQAPEDVIDEAQQIHDDLLREEATRFRGYEITTCGDAFQLAFHDMKDAIDYCLSVQIKLLEAKWPAGLENVVPSTKTVRSGHLKKHILFRGIRVRMGIHDSHIDDGGLVSQVHPVTGKTLYIGASEFIGREVGDVGYGGQIIVSKRVAHWLTNNQDQISIPCVLDYHGVHDVSQLDVDLDLYQVTPAVLDRRRNYFRKRRQCEDGEIAVDVDESGHDGTPGSGSATEGSASDYRAERSPIASDPSGLIRMWTKV